MTIRAQFNEYLGVGGARTLHSLAVLEALLQDLPPGLVQWSSERQEALLRIDVLTGGRRRAGGRHPSLLPCVGAPLLRNGEHKQRRDWLSLLRTPSPPPLPAHRDASAGRKRACATGWHWRGRGGAPAAAPALALPAQWRGGAAAGALCGGLVGPSVVC